MAKALTLKSRFKKYCTNPEVLPTSLNTNDDYMKYIEEHLTYDIPTDYFRLVPYLTEDRSRLTPIDEGFADLIIGLNKNGYFTEWCCTGHEADERGYIAFSSALSPQQNKNIDNVAISLMRSGVYVTEEIFNGGRCIRFRPSFAADPRLNDGRICDTDYVMGLFKKFFKPIMAE